MQWKHTPLSTSAKEDSYLSRRPVNSLSLIVQALVAGVERISSGMQNRVGQDSKFKVCLIITEKEVDGYMGKSWRDYG